MKILVTGATGYVGHELALTLAEHDNEVNVLIRDPLSAKVPVHKNIRVFPGDITNLQSIAASIQGCEQVYHTAALVKLFSKDPMLFQQVNVEGTNNMLIKSLEAGVKKFVFTSSCGVIGPTLNEPLTENAPRIFSFENDYEFTKYQAEKLVVDFSHKGLFTVIVAPSKVYGPGIETHPFSVNKIIHNFIKGKPTFIPMPGNLVTNYCYIKDVVEGHILAMTKGIGGEKYILGGENISYLDLFQLIRSISATNATLIETPKFFIKTWALLQWLQYKLTNKEPYVTNKAIQTIYCNKTFNSGKAMRQLGYQPTPFKESLEQTIHFLKTQPYV